MIKYNPYKKPIIPLLFLMSSVAFAADSGTYCIIRGSSGIHQEIQPADKDVENTSEWNIFQDQLSNIINEGKPLRGKVWEAARKTFSATPPYQIIETGIGYSLQLIIPSAIELKGIFEKKEKDVWYFHYSGNFKIFLPLSTHTKLYAKIGKSFLLNATVAGKSILSILDSDIQQDIKDTVWLKTPKDQWSLSRTILGVGFVKKISSKLEVDGSIEGYATREMKDYYFTTSLGVNYLFE